MTLEERMQEQNEGMIVIPREFVKKADDQRALDLAKLKFDVRFNPNHDEHGRFSDSDGGGSGGSDASGGMSEKDAKIADLEKQLSEAKGIFAKSKIKTQIAMVKDDFTGTAAEYNAMKAKQREEKYAEEKQEKQRRIEALEKQKQENDAKNEQSYMMSHRPSETGITADDLTNQDAELPMPMDMYDHPYKYFDTSQKSVQESLSALEKVKGNPNATIKVYRATQGDSINDGDWITLSKTYAEEHNSHSLGGNGKIIGMTVPVKDIQWAGDDINEWGYFPNKKRSVMNMNKDFEYRSYTFDLSAEQNDGAVGIVTGRPIVYNSKTDIGLFDEIIERGALDKTDLRDVRFLVNHDKTKIPLARSRNNNANSTMQLIPDEKGLQVKVKLDIENNTEARNLYSAIKRGDISGMSFMFSVAKNGDVWDFTNSQHPERRIKQIANVVEVSACTFPAYEDSSISVRNKEALDSAKSALDNARRSQQEALESETRCELELAKAKYYAKMKAGI